MSKHTVTLAAVACATLLLAGCSSGHTSGPASPAGPAGSAAVASDTIVIKNFAFHPANLTVAPGARVTVTNQDSATHTVTATGAKAFDTGDIAPGKTATFTAPTAPAVYSYICGIHQYMQGTLTVTSRVARAAHR